MRCKLWVLCKFLLFTPPSVEPTAEPEQTAAAPDAEVPEPAEEATAEPAALEEEKSKGDEEAAEDKAKEPVPEAGGWIGL